MCIADFLKRSIGTKNPAKLLKGRFLRCQKNYPLIPCIRDERITFRGTTRIRLAARFQARYTPKMDNGITRLFLLMFQAAAPGRKPVYCTHAAPTTPHSLKKCAQYRTTQSLLLQYHMKS